MRDPAELIPAEYNPRKLSSKQRDEIQASLTRFGFAEPILVNKHKDRMDIIIGGHQRTSVAKDMGTKEVPTVEMKLDLEKEKELNIRLNKNSGEFDFEILEEFFDQDELIDWGFDDWEFDSDDWETDIEAVDKVDENLDGIDAVIKIKLPQDDKDSAITQIEEFLNEKGFVGFEIS